MKKSTLHEIQGVLVTSGHSDLAKVLPKSSSNSFLKYIENNPKIVKTFSKLHDYVTEGGSELAKKFNEKDLELLRNVPGVKVPKNIYRGFCSRKEPTSKNVTVKGRLHSWSASKEIAIKHKDEFGCEFERRTPGIWVVVKGTTPKNSINVAGVRLKLYNNRSLVPEKLKDLANGAKQFLKEKEVMVTKTVKAKVVSIT